ncbi:MAG: acyl-CoA dehydrogenase [Halieaceae bacterium]|jgi:acyl-CoA dehydrogenase|nr:acyl-CoA dehydrogenase [Halieaceae bacterium]
MDFSPSERSLALQEQLHSFYERHIIPRWREWQIAIKRNNIREPDFVQDLRAEAKREGLWNMAVVNLGDGDPGTRLRNLEFAPLAEYMGRYHGSALVFNCQPPDVPNMIALEHDANAEQRERWLLPLLEGDMRSAFAMTEYDVASSDATNLRTSIRRDGDDYVINGHKWYITGAAHPDCEFFIVVGQTNPEAAPARQHSTIIVPTRTPGVRVSRELSYLGSRDATAPIGEVFFENVRVSSNNLLGREGDGFVSGQVRLGPARVHHCMRAIGNCEMLIELMMARAQERATFGRQIAKYDSVQNEIANSRIELEQARLMVQKTAWLLDRDGFRSARQEVSMIKVAVAQTYHRIADRALHIFGAMGGSEDTPIATAFSWARAFRIGDGPDEVHLRQIYRMEKQAALPLADSVHILPTS